MLPQSGQQKNGTNIAADVLFFKVEAILRLMPFLGLVTNPSQ
jgi:hypothetical protein